jgi:hypothetical protein
MNRAQLSYIAVSLASLMLALGETSALAQSGAPSALDSVGSVRQYVSDKAVPAVVSIPSNLVIADIYRPLVERMLRSSRTFRRQCLRIASEPRWTVHINIRSTPPRYGVRAVTTVKRESAGGATAIVEIFETNNDVELIAHEIEHVLEQVDGVDLRSLATMRDSGVRSVAPDLSRYETRRAMLVGAIVTREVSASRPKG